MMSIEMFFIDEWFVLLSALRELIIGK